MNSDDLQSRKKELYIIARNYLNEVEFDVSYDISDVIIENHLICYIVDHEFIPIPNIMIKLNLKMKSGILYNGYYSLFLDCEFKFLDEVLFFN